MPDLPYVEALRELTEIAQGFANDPSVLLVKEHNSCPQAKAWSEVMSQASGRVVNPRYLEFGALLHPPPGILPPLI